MWIFKHSPVSELHIELLKDSRLAPYRLSDYSDLNVEPLRRIWEAISNGSKENIRTHTCWIQVQTHVKL